MTIDIRYTDKNCYKVKVTYRKKEIMRFLHKLHDCSKKNNKHELYEIEENTRNVNLFFEFKNSHVNFETIVEYIESLFQEHVAFENKLKKMRKLEEANN